MTLSQYFKRFVLAGLISSAAVSNAACEDQTINLTQNQRNTDPDINNKCETYDKFNPAEREDYFNPCQIYAPPFSFPSEDSDSPYYQDGLTREYMVAYPLGKFDQNGTFSQEGQEHLCLFYSERFGQNLSRVYTDINRYEENCIGPGGNSYRFTMDKISCSELIEQSPGVGSHLNTVVETAHRDYEDLPHDYDHQDSNLVIRSLPEACFGRTIKAGNPEPVLIPVTATYIGSIEDTQDEYPRGFFYGGLGRILDIYDGSDRLEKEISLLPVSEFLDNRRDVANYGICQDRENVLVYSDDNNGHCKIVRTNDVTDIIEAYTP